MKNRQVFERFLYALLMGVLTVLFCLVLADGVIGMNAWASRVRDLVTLPGRIVFWGSIIGLPIVFSKWTNPVYSLINLPLYFFLYFPIKSVFDNVDIYWSEELLPAFLVDGILPDHFEALLTAFLFFGIECVVMTVSCWIRRKRTRIQ